MSTVQDSQSVWRLKDNVQSKYEKCLNITEEIYKRINITFQIKKLETEAQSEISDQSDQIDSNELSNETDLFACDKSSISSSTEPEGQTDKLPTKFININNNEEKPKTAVVYKRPRKRFRKRVKKRQWKRRDSEGSSDEAPLSRIADECDRRARPPQPTVTHIHPSADSKPKTLPVQPTKVDLKEALQKEPLVLTEKTETHKPVETKEINSSECVKEKTSEEIKKSCSICSLSFRGDRGLRRHMAMSHSLAENLRAKKETEMNQKGE